MNALELRIEYRPFRIGWCVTDGNIDDLVRAIRLTHCFWGGRYNPVIPVSKERDAECRRLVRKFRLTALYAVSADRELREFVDQFSWLKCLYTTELFNHFHFTGRREPTANLVDVAVLARAAARKANGFDFAADDYHQYVWVDDDPLRHIMLSQFGGYPDPGSDCPDYGHLVVQALGLEHSWQTVGKEDPLPSDSWKAYTPNQLTTLGLNVMEPTNYLGNYPGVFIGSASAFADIVNFWNLRAAGIELVFYDPQYTKRMTGLKDHWLGALEARPKGPILELFGPISVWTSRGERRDELDVAVANATRCIADDETFAAAGTEPYIIAGPGQNVLAMLVEHERRPAVAFQLPRRPFADDAPLSNLQHHIAGVSCPVEFGLPDEYTLSPPYVPLVNQFLSKECGIIGGVRSELNDLGVIVKSDSNSLKFGAVRKRCFAERVFEAFGIKAEISEAGLVAARIIGHMGGLQGCRVFKISGVRQLIQKHNPMKAFTRDEALELIGRELAKYNDLILDSGQHGQLTPQAVFNHLVKRGILQIGLEFACPSCSLKFWRHLDDAVATATCEYCRSRFDVALQLKGKDWKYRRSGVFGASDNLSGAIPVVLVMQLLHTQHMRNFLGESPPIILPSMNLANASILDSGRCETDLLVIHSPLSTLFTRKDKVQVVLGECKNYGKEGITSGEARKLLSVARILEDRAGFTVYIIFAKLAQFEREELEVCRSVNEKYRHRAIVLTQEELEINGLSDINGRDMLEKLAQRTHSKYWASAPQNP